MAIHVNVKAAYGLAGLLVVAVFLADIFTPQGLIVWILYALPLLIVAETAERRVTYGLAALCTVLIGANFFFSPRGLPQVFEIFNSTLGALVLWAVALLLAQRRQTREALAHEKDLLEAAVRERTAELVSANAALQKSQEQARDYARRLVEEIENERRNIARELHDEAGQSLTAILLGLSALERETDRSGSGARLSGSIRELQHMTGDVMDGLHRLSRNLRPASLDRLGLVAALRQHIQSFEQQTGIEVEFAPVRLDQERLPDEIETALYRIVQEALTNVARHARARRAGVVLKRRGQRVIAIVEDDGSGFDLTEAMKRGRLGLTGMRERTELLGGRLEIESAVGKGTSVFVDLPAR